MARGRSPAPPRRRVKKEKEEEKEEQASSTDDAANEEEVEKIEHVDEFEFGGWIGAAFIMPGLSLLLYFLYYGASKNYKFNVVNALELPAHLPQTLSEFVDAVWSFEAFAVYVCWFGFQVILERLLYCEKVEGVELPNGKRLTYRINGHLAFWVSVLAMGHGWPLDEQGNVGAMRPLPLAWVYDNYVKLATAASVFSWLLAICLYAKSHFEGALLAHGGNTSSGLYNFFIGRELNPRIGSFDLKEFCELRPGLIGWVVVNMSCLVKQRQLNGGGAVSPALLLVNLFQGLYVWDALYFERAILTTMDITTDGFGWMLAFGDLAWVPFTYSLQARYLVENDPGLSPPALVLITVLKVVSYAAFRGANLEKDRFRRDPTAPEVRHLKTLKTKAGRKLLVSGWWGMARKINYTADLGMGLAWCALTGTDCALTYFYFVYFAVLLVHRALRDDHACQLKYGKDWDTYKSKVPYMFIPGVI